MSAIRCDNAYVSLAAEKSLLNYSTSTTDDARICAAIAAASRAFDHHTHRKFYVETQTRYFTACRREKLRVQPDLLAVTALDTDDGADRSYSYSWAATDYELGPYNARLEGKPYSWIEAKPLGIRVFPQNIVKGVRVAGQWGYDSTTELPGSTLGAAITDTTGTSVTVAAGTGALLSVADRILIDSEQLLITAVATDTLTVIRGYNGTTAATHLISTAISRYVAPATVQQIVSEVVTNFFHGPDSDRGSAGPAELGFVAFGTAFNKRIRDLAWQFCRPTVA